jgi:hypothetical protein
MTEAKANPKLRLDDSYVNAGLMLAPHKLSGKNVCPMATVDNEEHARIWLAMGGNIAVIFAGMFPTTFWGSRVVSGMDSDLRFNDPEGVVVALTVKGKAKGAGHKPCSFYCLNTAGRGAMNTAQKARLNRTMLFHDERDVFMSKLEADLDTLTRAGQREGKPVACRLNTLSDLRWERIAPHLFTQWEHIQFYDYTKVPGRSTPDNYHLTYSLQYVR